MLCCRCSQQGSASCTHARCWVLRLQWHCCLTRQTLAIEPGWAPDRGRLRGRDPPLGRLLRWNSSGWPLEVGDPPYSGRGGVYPMLLGIELPMGAVKSPPGTLGMLSGKVSPPEHCTSSVLADVATAALS